MGKAFQKGDKVTIITSWDDRGTVAFVQCLVHSCGKKRLLLTVEETGEQYDLGLWRTHVPRVATGGEQGVIPRVEGEALHATALAVALRYLIDRQMHFARCLAGDHGEGYSRCIRKNIAELHEPRVLDYEEYRKTRGW